MNFDDLISDQPDVPDWSGLVRHRIAQARRTRRVTVTLAATSLVVLGTVGAVYATGGSTQPSVVALDPSQTPTPDETPTPEPSATPTPDHTPTSEPPTPTASATASTAPSPTAEVPDSEPQTVVIDALSYTPHDPTDGERVTFTLQGHWSASRPSGYAYCTDCDPLAIVGVPSCGQRLGPPSVPPKEPGEGVIEAIVVMRSPGRHHVAVSLSSGPCGYYHGGDTRVVVIDTAPAPTPTPTPTPSGSDEPSPTATPETSPEPTVSPT